MPSKLGKQFDILAAWVRKNVDFQFSVRSVVNLKMDGEKCHATLLHRDGGERYIICLERTDPYAVLEDSLLHEIAHAQTMEEGEYTEDYAKQHSARWGVFYARLYKKWRQVCDEKDRGAT